MNIQITSRHSKVSRETHRYLKKELTNLEKFCDRITSCHVKLDNEHVNKVVEINFSIQGNTINAKAKSDNLGKSIDLAIQKIKRQLKKNNQKVKNHKNNKDMISTFHEDVYSEKLI
ncbi:MAG: ribosome-associated translation inhibitor RaiA [Chitinispirillia bacterium]|jgi:putative sigma-54 modulation protein